MYMVDRPLVTLLTFGLFFLFFNFLCFYIMYILDDFFFMYPRRVTW